MTTEHHCENLYLYSTPTGNNVTIKHVTNTTDEIIKYMNWQQLCLTFEFRFGFFASFVKVGQTFSNQLTNHLTKSFF